MEIPLQAILEELERREQNRNFNRFLRDASDPFQMPEEIFRKFYRLDRESGQELFFQMNPHFTQTRRNTKIPNVVKFFVALHFYAHGSYQKSVARDKLCSMSQASVSRCIHEVTNIIVNHFSQTYMRFPTEMQDIIAVKTRFFEKFQFPGIIGCIDGTHIRIFPPPSLHPVYPGNVFINRKNFHSINCQIICDCDLKILALNARFPGSVNDAAVWLMSNIRQNLINNFENGDRTTWLLGDSGYPLQPFLLTPILDADPHTPEGRYAAAHILVRNCVERCIGVWKSYFRCLLQDRVLHYAPPFAAKIIYACATLHNILRTRGIVDEDMLIVIDEDIVEEIIPEDPYLQQGRRVRDNLIQQHFV